MLWGWVILECKITDGKLTEGEGVFAQGTKHARTVPECKKCKCKDCEMYHRGLLCNESFKKKGKRENDHKIVCTLLLDETLIVSRKM